LRRDDFDYLHTQRIDMQIRDEDISRLNHWLRLVARIRSAAMCELVAHARRLFKVDVAVGQLGKVEELLG
jgi:hypothetical protein